MKGRKSSTCKTKQLSYDLNKEIRKAKYRLYTLSSDEAKIFIASFENEIVQKYLTQYRKIIIMRRYGCDNIYHALYNEYLREKEIEEKLYEMIEEVYPFL